MTRMVTCSKYGENLEGLVQPPLHGAQGDEIFARVSQRAWDEWLEMQLKIINEYHLDLSERTDRDTLRGQMRTFLGLEDESESGLLDVGTPTEQAP